VALWDKAEERPLFFYAMRVLDINFRNIFFRKSFLVDKK